MLKRVLLTESIATLRTALFPLARLHPMPPEPEHDNPPIVLVHGYLGHPDMFRPLIRRLHKEGFGSIHTVKYPSTKLRLEEIAGRIDDVVRPLDQPVWLVGHSLGAVASRAYIKLFGGAPVVSRFLSLGGPHAGTSIYRFAPARLWDVLNPQGPWVRQIRQGPEPVPTVVIRARFDHQVLPPLRASLPDTTERVLDGHGHNGLLWATDAHDAVVDALRGFAQETS